MLKLFGLNGHPKSLSLLSKTLKSLKTPSTIKNSKSEISSSFEQLSLFKPIITNRSHLENDSNNIIGSFISNKSFIENIEDDSSTELFLQYSKSSLKKRLSSFKLEKLFKKLFINKNTKNLLKILEKTLKISSKEKNNIFPVFAQLVKDSSPIDSSTLITNLATMIGLRIKSENKFDFLGLYYTS